MEITIRQFILLFDGGQADDTEIIITMNGEEIARGTLGEAQECIQDVQNGFIVKSFMFYGNSIQIEVK